MTQITPNLGLVKPGGGSTGLNTPPDRVDVDVLNANFDKIDLAVGDPDEQSRQWYGPAASIGTLPVTPKDGDTYRESDGDKKLWSREGGVWVTYENGLFLVRPTAVAAASGTAAIQPNGTVFMTNVGTEVRIDGCFSSRFRRYFVKVSVEAASADTDTFLAFRNAGAGVGAGQAHWVRSETTSLAGPTRVTASGQNHISGGRVGASGGIVNHDIQHPGHPARKFVTGDSFSTDLCHRVFGGQVIISTAADGFSFGTQSGTTITGSIRILGVA